jgi:hypothetical protein
MARRVRLKALSASAFALLLREKEGKLSRFIGKSSFRFGSRRMARLRVSSHDAKGAALSARARRMPAPLRCLQAIHAA